MVDQHVAPSAVKPAVVVLGGGIAGIATAISLRDRGYPVTLVEARRFLGGRVFSFTDEETGVSVDNGQHVFLGCCTYFIQLLMRLGVFQQWYLQPRWRLKVLDRAGKAGLLAAARLPAPLHLLGALVTYPHLGWGDKVRVLATLVRVRFTNRHQPRLERISFYQWLKQQGQTEAAIAKLWNLLIVPSLNDDARDVSASMGLMIFQEGLLRGRHSADVGYAADGLSPAIGEPARRRLEAAGVQVRLGSPVQRILVDSGQVTGLALASGETITGQLYVSALPPQGLWQVLPEPVQGLPFFAGLPRLEMSPIVNVHLWYDRPVMEDHFCAFVDSPLQWVFNKSAIMGLTPGFATPSPSLMERGSGGEAGQYICVSLSAAWEYIDQPREELARCFIGAMAEAFPRARTATVQRVVVVKQRHATFRCLPGAREWRPGSQTPIANLFLAGEWTDTGWPSTMESAVRSGYNATQAIAAVSGGPKS
jgi:squalene-associated FAD-dependent desaturase